MYVTAQPHNKAHTCRNQRTTFRSGLSSSTVGSGERTLSLAKETNLQSISCLVLKSVYGNILNFPVTNIFIVVMCIYFNMDLFSFHHSWTVFHLKQLFSSVALELGAPELEKKKGHPGVINSYTGRTIEPFYKNGNLDLSLRREKMSQSLHFHFLSFPPLQHH